MVKHGIDRWKYPIILAPAIALLIGMGAYHRLTATVGVDSQLDMEPQSLQSEETATQDDGAFNSVKQVVDASQSQKVDADSHFAIQAPAEGKIQDQVPPSMDNPGEVTEIAKTGEEKSPEPVVEQAAEKSTGKAQSDVAAATQVRKTPDPDTGSSGSSLPSLSATLNACLDREIARIATEARGENASVDEVMEACRKQANAFNRAFRNAYPGEDELLAIRTKTRTLAVAKRLLALREP